MDQAAVNEILSRIEQLSDAECRFLEEQLAARANAARRGDARQPNRSQAQLLAEMRKHSHKPPPGTPESVELLRQDRER